MTARQLTLEQQMKWHGLIAISDGDNSMAEYHDPAYVQSYA